MKALLLDLDDTLVTYAPGDDPWLAATLDAKVCDVPADRLQQAITASRRAVWGDADLQRRERVNMPRAFARIVGKALGQLDVEVAEDRLAAIGRDCAQRLLDRVILLSDTLGALDAFRARGIPLGLLTNGDANMQRAKLRKCELTGYFSVFAFESEIGAGKPDAAVYRHALDLLGLPPADVWMAGDNFEYDVAAPQRAGLHVAWFNPHAHPLPAGTPCKPDRIIRSLLELVRDADSP